MTEIYNKKAEKTAKCAVANIIMIDTSTKNNV